MAKDSDDKPAAVKEAEAHGGQTFDPTVTQDSGDKSREELLSSGKCPDCGGKGIRNLTDTRVCQTCQGSGKA